MVCWFYPPRRCHRSMRPLRRIWHHPWNLVAAPSRLQFDLAHWQRSSCVWGHSEIEREEEKKIIHYPLSQKMSNQQIYSSILIIRQVKTLTDEQKKTNNWISQNIKKKIIENSTFFSMKKISKAKKWLISPRIFMFWAIGDIFSHFRLFRWCPWLFSCAKSTKKLKQ